MIGASFTDIPADLQVRGMVKGLAGKTTSTPCSSHVAQILDPVAYDNLQGFQRRCKSPPGRVRGRSRTKDASQITTIEDNKNQDTLNLGIKFQLPLIKTFLHYIPAHNCLIFSLFVHPQLFLLNITLYQPPVLHNICVGVATF